MKTGILFWDFSKKLLLHLYCRNCENFTLLNLEKRQYLPHYWSDKGFKGIVVNLALSSLAVGSLEITLTVPLNLRGVRQLSCLKKYLTFGFSVGKFYYFQQDGKCFITEKNWKKKKKLLPVKLYYQNVFKTKLLGTHLLFQLWTFSLCIHCKTKTNKKKLRIWNSRSGF